MRAKGHLLSSSSTLPEACTGHPGRLRGHFADHDLLRPFTGFRIAVAPGQ